MHARPVTDDIVVLHDQVERAVLVRGHQFATAIDLPTRPECMGQLLAKTHDLGDRGLRMAILTHEPEDGPLPIECVEGLRLVRADRKPDQAWYWDVVPPSLLRVPAMPVHVVREPKTLYDDTGRAYYVERSAGSQRDLAVLIEPEDVLVVADDIRPNMPPRIRPGDVNALSTRLAEWRDRAPEVLIPASGIPIAGDRLAETLHQNLTYVRKLRDRLREGLLQAHFPWERLVYTIPWCDVWDGASATGPLVERHRANIRDMATDLWGARERQAERPLRVPAVGAA